EPLVQIHTQPAPRPHIRRHEEMPRLAFDVDLLRARRRVEPQRDAPITMMIDGVHGERLAPHGVVRGPMSRTFLGFGKREAHLSNGVAYGFLLGRHGCEMYRSQPRARKRLSAARRLRASFTR